MFKQPYNIDLYIKPRCNSINYTVINLYRNYCDTTLIGLPFKNACILSRIIPTKR